MPELLTTQKHLPEQRAYFWLPFWYKTPFCTVNDVLEPSLCLMEIVGHEIVKVPLPGIVPETELHCS